MVPPSVGGEAQRRIPLTMIGKSFYAKCRVLMPGSKVKRMAPVTEMQEKTIVQAEEVIEEDSGARGSGDVVQENPARAILGQTSAVDALRGRLKELRRLGVTEAAVYGTKQELWERLVKRKAFYDEKERVRKAILDRHKRIQEGSDPEVPATLNREA